MTNAMMDDVAQIDSYSVGGYGFTVRIYRRKVDGPFHFEIPSSGERKVIRRPKLYGAAEARRWAHRRSEELERGIEALGEGRVDLGFIFDTYLANRTPEKALATQKEDRRRAKMWLKVLGANRLPSEIRLAHWTRFIEDRRSGRIGPDGSAPQSPSSVLPRTVVADLKWLKAALGWATKWRTPGGAYLLDESPVRGFPMPEDKNPRQERASHERYVAIMKALEDAIADAGEKPESWMLVLRDVLPVVRWQGRRIGSVRLLQNADVHLKEGRIEWRADADKKRRRWVTPLHPDAKAAIQRARARNPGAGTSWLYPSTRDRKSPISKRYMATIHAKGEALVKPKLEDLDGTRWHAWRRLRATELKRAGVPMKDAADFLGMSTMTLQTIYQQSDATSLWEAALVGPVLEDQAKEETA